MGVVLKGFDPLLERAVAIKILSPHLASCGTSRQRFLREARLAAAVVHENVVTIHAVSAGPPPYLVMQLVAGVTLEEHLKQVERLEVDEVVRIGLQTARGLEAAHRQGLIHRDVKPGNILLEEGLRVKITDFGLARAVNEPGLSQPGAIAGTPLFMSPEQARGKPLDHRSDLFSLGSVLYVLCTGRPPFWADNNLAVLNCVCTETPELIQQINPAIPEWLSAVIQKLLAKDPSERFQSAAELADVLEQRRALAAEALRPPPWDVRTNSAVAPYRPQTPAGPPPTGSLAPAPPRRFRLAWLLAGAALISLTAFGAAAWFLGHRLPHKPTPRKVPPGSLPARFVNPFSMEFVLVPRGQSWLEGGGGKEGDLEFEIPYDFYLGKYEVTQEQWEALTGRNPNHFSRTGAGQAAVKEVSSEELKQLPVETVSIEDILVFLNALNRKDQEPGWTYCLPLKEEWEYACRGGPLRDRSESAFDYYFDKPTNQLHKSQANFAHPSALKRPCKVGSYEPNRLGLHDMHGNVSEWCDPSEPSPHAFPSPEVARGGSWEAVVGSCRASSFKPGPPVLRNKAIGLRLARVYVGQDGE